MSSAMKVRVNIETDEFLKYPLEVLSTDTIIEVKKKFKKLTGVKVGRQSFWLNGLELRNDYDVEFYELKSGASVSLKVAPVHKPGQKFNIQTIVYASNGTATHCIDAHDKITVAQLKFMIYSVMGMPIAGMKVYHRDMEMEDINYISAYYVSDDSIVEVFLD